MALSEGLDFCFVTDNPDLENFPLFGIYIGWMAECIQNHLQFGR